MGVDNPVRQLLRLEHLEREVRDGWIVYNDEVRFAKYGLDGLKIAQFLIYQENACPGCGVTFDKVKFVIDHDHSVVMPDFYGVRGLLCSRCNVALHRDMDSSALRRLADYLEAYEQAQRDAQPSKALRQPPRQVK